jgi:hypothetical protein
MEQQNKYYTPDISELYVGYECEIGTSWGFSKGKFPEVLTYDTLTGFAIQKATDLIDVFRAGSLRTKYLDQSDIESLGWENCRKLTDWFGKNDKPNQVGFDMQNMMLGYDYDSHILAITVKDPTKSEDGKTEVYDYPKNVKWFRGECKSINELRKIMEWLNIK